MPDLGPHAAYILAAYAGAALVVAALIAMVALTSRRQKARLDRLEAETPRRRRSDSGETRS